jgi:hypothetical protein
MVGKPAILGADQNLETGIGARAENDARYRPDLMPFDAVQPAILVGARGRGQDDGHQQAARFAALDRRFQAIDEFHIGLDLRRLGISAPAQRTRDISDDQSLRSMQAAFCVFILAAHPDALVAVSGR